MPYIAAVWQKEVPMKKDEIQRIYTNIKILDTFKGDCIQSIALPNEWINSWSLLYSPDGKYIAYVDNKLFDLVDQRIQLLHNISLKLLEPISDSSKIMSQIADASCSTICSVQ